MRTSSVPYWYLRRLLQSVPLRRPLQTKAAVFLGRISFAMYILHFIVLGSVGAALLIALRGVLPYNVNALAVLVVS